MSINHEHDDERGFDRSRLANRPWGKLIAGAVVGLGIIITGLDMPYVVQPTDMAGLRRLGTVIVTQPVGPGLHFKAPFIDTVDKTQVSIETMIAKMPTRTIDNQAVEIDVKMLYQKTPEAVLPLLYNLGRPGDANITDTIESIMTNIARKVMSQENTISVSADQQKISDQIRSLVTDELAQRFKVKVNDFQLIGIQYSPLFEKSIENAVTAKNNALAAENQVAQVRYQGEQAKVNADVAAYSARTQADAAEYSTKKAADAQAYTIEANGRAQAEATRAQAAALKTQHDVFSTDLGYVAYTAATKWAGAVPTTVVTLPDLSQMLKGVLPLPKATAAAAAPAVSGG